MYTKKLYAGWADMDFNSHMKNTAYLDKTADVRQMFLIEHGFPMEEFVRLRIGPVVMKDEVEYFGSSCGTRSSAPMASSLPVSPAPVAG